MTTTVTCSACGRRVRVPAGRPGAQIRCPECQAVVPVPAKPCRRRTLLLVAGLGLAALVVAAVVGVLVYRHFSPGRDDAAELPSALPPGYRPTLRIPVPKVPPGDFRRVLLARPPAAFALVKTDLWDLQAPRKLGTVSYTVGPTTLQVLSPDGRHLALVESGRVRVLALPGGEEVWHAEADKDGGNPDFVDFPEPGRLAVGRADGRVDFLALPAGDKLGSIAARRCQPHEAAFSPDGRTLAVFTTDQLTVYEAPSGKKLFEWTPARGQYKQLISPSGLAFSPDGRELAALCPLGGPAVLLCWDVAAGRLADEYPVGSTLHAVGVGYRGPAVQWLPDGSGWLLGGHVLYHRAARRIVWLFRTRLGVEDIEAVLDRGRLLAPVREGEQEGFLDVPVPWADIEAGLQALDRPAPLRPGQPVSVQVDVGRLQLADSAGIQKDLHALLVERLAAEGIPVAEDQSTVVYARYSEAPGGTVRILDFSRSPRPAGAPTTARETKLALEVGVRTRDRAAPLWRTYLSQGAGLIVSGQGTTADVHRDAVESLKRTLSSLALPYYVPAEGQGKPLPLVSQL